MNKYIFFLCFWSFIDSPGAYIISSTRDDDADQFNVSKESNITQEAEMLLSNSNSPPLYWIDLMNRISNRNGTGIIRTKKMTSEDFYAPAILALYNESKFAQQEEESLGFTIYRIFCLALLVMLLFSAILYQINRILSIKIEFFSNPQTKRKTRGEVEGIKSEADPAIIVPLNEYHTNQPNNDSEQNHE